MDMGDVEHVSGVMDMDMGYECMSDMSEGLDAVCIYVCHKLVPRWTCAEIKLVRSSKKSQDCKGKAERHVTWPIGRRYANQYGRLSEWARYQVNQLDSIKM